jgi:hypothetical protein
MSPEEFFMYLTIALIVLIPISARVYRYFTVRRVKRMVREQFREQPPIQGTPAPPTKDLSNER